MGSYLTGPSTDEAVVALQLPSLKFCGKVLQECNSIKVTQSAAHYNVRLIYMDRRYNIIQLHVPVPFLRLPRFVEFSHQKIESHSIWRNAMYHALYHSISKLTEFVSSAGGYTVYFCTLFISLSRIHQKLKKTSTVEVKCFD